MTSHYDKNLVEGSPRKAWVKVGLISDLSLLISKPAEDKAAHLTTVWKQNWEEVSHNVQALERLNNELDIVRKEIRINLKTLD